MSAPLAAPRPTSVTIAIVLGWIGVVADAIGGVALLVLAGNADVLSSLSTDASTARTMGIILLVVAVILAACVYLLGNGSNAVRMLLSVVMILRVAVSVWVIIALGTHNLTEAVVTIVISSVVLWLVWNQKANEFFATN